MAEGKLSLCQFILSNFLNFWQPPEIKHQSYRPVVLELSHLNGGATDCLGG